jgi:hypothetical protein
MLVAALATVAIATTAATWWLLGQTWNLSEPDRARARLEAIRTGLTVGAGTGGGLALLLALRRQWHHEKSSLATLEHQSTVAADARHDAEERRITDLYVKAGAPRGALLYPRLSREELKGCSWA